VLPERRAVTASAADRERVVAAVEGARALADGGDARKALELLRSVRPLDPVGAVLALEICRAARAAHDETEALTSCEVARVGAALAPSLEEATRTGEHVPAPEVRGPLSARQPCDAVADARDGASDAGAQRSCWPDLRLELGAGRLRAATALRIETPGAVEGWVVLEGAAGEAHVFGPVASVARPNGLANDVVLDLQRIDVRPGGSAELVVRCVERRTLPDLALGEVLELDETRATFLSLDTGRVEVSRTLLLSRAVVRRALDGLEGAPPRGYVRSPDLGRARSHEVQVSWGAPNTITLTRSGGTDPPPDVGTLQLFGPRAD
jgi:hypothetical protein